MQAVGGQLAHRNVSVMPYIEEPTWFMRYMKAGPGRHTEAACKHGGGSGCARVLWVVVEPSELHFNLKRAYQTQDVGQPMTQGGKYPRLKSNQVYWWCARFKQRNFYIKVAFFNQFLHIQPQTSHQPHVAFSQHPPPPPAPPSRFQSIFECNDKNITRHEATMACRNASQRIFSPTQCAVCLK